MWPGHETTHERPYEVSADDSVLSTATRGSEAKNIIPWTENTNLMPTVEYLNYDVVDDKGWDMYSGEVFDKAAEEGLDDQDYGTLEVNEGEYILEAAEAQGYDWPFSCRAGACANCAAIVIKGEIDMDMQQILSDEEVEEKNVRLTCIGSAATDEVRIVYNAKHLDYLQNRVI
jgi:2Fe-2S type ferredoxin